MEISLNLLPESERRHSVLKGMDSLPFGKLRCDHMFVMDYANKEWSNPRIVPYGDFSVPPGAIALHYGQAIFEGAKAFRHEDGEIYTFRFEKNAERLNRSADIMCMPHVPVDMQVQGLMRLLDIEREWCPTIPESSLYIRPFLFATEDALGVKPSDKFTYCIMLSPSGPYYAGGFNKTVTLLITEQFHRATPGGTGAAKAAGNYAASLRAQLFAQSKGAAQVLYLDASNTYLEEVGAMNHFHVMRDGSVVIPEFTDTILQSITSESVLELLPNARQERVNSATSSPWSSPAKSLKRAASAPQPLSPPWASTSPTKATPSPWATAPSAPLPASCTKPTPASRRAPCPTPRAGSRRFRTSRPQGQTLRTRKPRIAAGLFC